MDYNKSNQSNKFNRNIEILPGFYQTWLFEHYPKSSKKAIKISPSRLIN